MIRGGLSNPYPQQLSPPPPTHTHLKKTLKKREMAWFNGYYFFLLNGRSEVRILGPMLGHLIIHVYCVISMFISSQNTFSLWRPKEPKVWFVCLCVRICVFLSAFACVCMSACSCVRVFICTCMRACVCVCARVCMYAILLVLIYVFN